MQIVSNVNYLYTINLIITYTTFNNLYTVKLLIMKDLLNKI